MIVEEPHSPDQREREKYEVIVSDDDESMLEQKNFEEEALKLLNKRKIEAEVTAEKKARLTHNYYRKQGINLSEVIDEVAANHEDLHEKATTIRLQLEEEQGQVIVTNSI